MDRKEGVYGTVVLSSYFYTLFITFEHVPSKAKNDLQVRVFESHHGSLTQSGMKHLRAFSDICNEGISMNVMEAACSGTCKELQTLLCGVCLAEDTVLDLVITSNSILVAALILCKETINYDLLQKKLYVLISSPCDCS